MEYLSRDISNLRMALHHSNLNVCSFNCRSVKSSVEEICMLCGVSDLVLLQEHWLLPHELCYLSNIHPDFLAIGLSAIDLSNGILTGRPYGGTAILYRKTLSANISHERHLTHESLQLSYSLREDRS